MSAPEVYVTRRLPEPALDLLRDHVRVRLWERDMPPPRDTFLRQIAGCEAVLCMLTEQMNAEAMDAAPDLKVISTMSVGYDHIDLEAATARKLPVGHTPGVLTETTADLAFALLLAAARRLPEAETYVKAGQWQTWSPTLLLGQDLHGATLGIVGLGRIGQAVARRARGFGMHLLYHGGSDAEAARALGAEARTFDDLLRESDFVSLHAPLNDHTHHLIGERELALMKPTAILVNTGRGGLVDSAALYTALRDQSLAAAALDVTEPEPIDHDDPLLTLENCLVVPHIGSSTVATRTKMATIAAENVLAGLRGEELPQCANPAVYDTTHE